MEFLFFLIFFGIIIFNAFNGKGTKKPVKAKHFRSPKSHGNSYDGLPDAASRVNAARRAVQTGSATAAKYKRLSDKRRATQNQANSGLWASKHRQDKNRHRRTDWGAQGDSALLSPKMIGIIGGGLLTFYLVLTVIMPGSVS